MFMIISAISLAALSILFTIFYTRLKSSPNIRLTIHYNKILNFSYSSPSLTIHIKRIHVYIAAGRLHLDIHSITSSLPALSHSVHHSSSLPAILHTILSLMKEGQSGSHNTHRNVERVYNDYSTSVLSRVMDSMRMRVYSLVCNFCEVGVHGEQRISLLFSDSRHCDVHIEARGVCVRLEKKWAVDGSIGDRYCLFQAVLTVDQVGLRADGGGRIQTKGIRLDCRFAFERSVHNSLGVLVEEVRVEEAHEIIRALLVLGYVASLKGYRYNCTKSYTNAIRPADDFLISYLINIPFIRHVSLAVNYLELRASYLSSTVSGLSIKIDHTPSYEGVSAPLSQNRPEDGVNFRDKISSYLQKVKVEVAGVSAVNMRSKAKCVFVEEARVSFQEHIVKHPNSPRYSKTQTINLKVKRVEIEAGEDLVRLLSYFTHLSNISAYYSLGTYIKYIDQYHFILYSDRRRVRTLDSNEVFTHMIVKSIDDVYNNTHRLMRDEEGMFTQDSHMEVRVEDVEVHLLDRVYTIHVSNVQIETSNDTYSLLDVSYVRMYRAGREKEFIVDISEVLYLFKHQAASGEDRRMWVIFRWVWVLRRRDTGERETGNAGE